MANIDQRLREIEDALNAVRPTCVEVRRQLVTAKEIEGEAWCRRQRARDSAEEADHEWLEASAKVRELELKLKGTS